MDRQEPEERQVGIGLLLAGSNAFGHLAEQLAEAHEHFAAGGTFHLGWFQSLAELAGWWCGHLEAEADYAAGFLPDDPEEVDRAVAFGDQPCCPPSLATHRAGTRRCRRDRP